MPLNVPPPDPLFVAVGATLMLGAGLSLAWQRALWHRLDARPELADWQRNFHRGRYGRRAKVAWLFLTIGAAIPLGDMLVLAVPRRFAPAAFTVFLAVLFTAIAAILVLALADALAGGLHTRDRLADVRARRVALERDLLRLKAELDHAGARKARREGAGRRESPLLDSGVFDRPRWDGEE